MKPIIQNFKNAIAFCRELKTSNIDMTLLGIMFDIFSWAKISVKKEAPMNFLIIPHERRSTFRPANILVMSV